jgi:3-hydroxyisobutyrate dehydrogenase
MSRRLLEAGYTVTAYDLSDDARRRAASLGAAEARSLADVAHRAQVVILMLPGSEVVASVLEDAGFLDHLQPGSLVIDMSSSEPLRTRDLAEALRKQGFRMIDAPVSGGVRGAETGKLTIMVGGEEADLEAARRYLEQLGRLIHAGPIGAGHAVKALNNLLSATHLWVTSEAILAGQRFGIDTEVMLSIFNSSSGRSGSTDNKWPNFIRPATFDSGFGLRLMVKDMNIAVQLASQVGVPSRLGSDALELWSRASQALPPDADHTEVARWLEEEGRARGE